MADSGQQIVMLDPGTTLIENGNIVTVANANEVDQEVNEDILKQALEEASKGFGDSEAEYSGETVQVVADSNGQLTEGSTVVGEDGTTYTLVPAGDGTDTVHAVPHTVQTLDEQHILQLQGSKAIVDDDVTTVDSDVVDSQTVTIQSIDSDINDEVNSQSGIHPIENSISTIVGDDQAQGGSRTVTVVTTNRNGEPLGTSTNPIRIIQQGNQYTSMQQLSAEQLAQIMQVVQQQQLARNSAGGSTVLFNPQTQTRIVYKVIYPELQGNKIAITGGAKKVVNGPRQITVPKSMVTVGAFGRRQYKKRSREDEEKVDGPELTKEEKEERKKHRPRTRSGRVSKPPKHMVKDYKHIHHLDWDEDYDDSDGGYSDFRLSEEEDDDDGGSSVDRSDKTYMNAGLLSNKPKEYKCDKCPKAYIGKAGLARHYRLNPDHGDAEELMGSGEGKNGLDGSLTDESTQDSVGSASNQSQLTVASTTSMSSQPSTQPVDSIVSLVSTSPSTTTTTSVTPTVGRPVRPGPGRPRGSRGRHHFFYGESSAQRRKFKLKELMKQCTNEELMEVVLPRLARVITLWEFLMMKVEKGRPAKPSVQDVCSEFEELQKHVKKMCQEQLHPLGGQTVPSAPKCQLRDEAVAQSLGFSAGTFAVKEKPPLEELLTQPVRFKVVNSDSGIVQKISQPVKRVALSPEQAIAPKKQRIFLARDDTQNRTMVLHTNSTSPIQTVPGRSLLKPSSNIVLTSTANVVTSSPKAQTVVSTNSGMMQPSPITASGQYSIIKVGQPSSSAAKTVQQPQQILVNSQSQMVQTSFGQTIVISPQTVDEGVKEEEEQPSIEAHIEQHEKGQQETEMQQEDYSVQEAAAQETNNLNGHFDTVEQNTQDDDVETNGESDMAKTDHNEMEDHYVVSTSEESQVYLQQAAEDQNGEMLNQEGENQLVVAEGDTTQILLQQGEDGEHQIIEGANIFQTEDGLILIQNPDGTFQIHGNSDQPIPLETVQALLAMDGQLQEGQQVLQVQEQMQVEEHEQMHVQEHLQVEEQEQGEMVEQQLNEENT